MFKKFLYIGTALVLTACDNVDISKYPEGVQKCYNGIVFNDENCTKSKKTIVRYCECSQGQEAKINAKAAELEKDIRGANAMAGLMNRQWGGLFMAGAQNDAREKLEEYVQELYDECAKKTGYTRIKNCPKPDNKEIVEEKKN